mmetsp:Transcript_20648/g.63107  ORF Transcript_20648/g.63107 Transcript_20648/m.63107 type:complete len:287 (-) Transcript_20648:173-1033(-)|eukprot:scaffold71279_cov30-Tisochrysis_lutea.AAC.1
MAQRTVSPVSADLGQAQSLREVCVQAFQDTLSPMLILRGHGCEDACAELVSAAKRQLASASSTCPPNREHQRAHLLEGPLAGKADTLRGCLLNLCWRVLDDCLGGNQGTAQEVFAQAGMELEGRLCVREYPRHLSHPEIRIGAHLDSTLMTLLWSDSPGLEVLHPPQASNPTKSTAQGSQGDYQNPSLAWTGEEVMRIGFPSCDGSATREVLDHEWARVTLSNDEDWSAGPLLLTIGSEWLKFPPTAAAMPVVSAVLHRVAMPLNSPRDRFSLPFLVNLRTIRKQE